MTARSLLIAALVALLGAAPGLAQPAPDETAPPAEAVPPSADEPDRVYDCAFEDVTYAVTVAPDDIDARVAVTLTGAPDSRRTYTLGLVAPFPNFDFADGVDRFYRAGDGIFFSNPNTGPVACTLRSPELDPEGPLDIAGASLGGRLRAGPGTQFAPLGLLQPGAPLTISRRTDSELDDFFWFEVIIDDTRLFHWGGIMCAEDYAVAGLAGRCDDALDAAALDLVSRGGNVRSGPGTGFDDLGVIDAETPVTVISNTGIVLDGQPWYEIAWSEGTAYHWGGLICAEGTGGDTAFEPC